MLLFLIKPGQQLNKARDSSRKEDFKQIRIALDTYYNDHNCYPASLAFGTEWKEGATVYMKKIPQDPGCGRSGSACYTYVVDSASSCPQWHVLFGKLAIAPSTALPACLLEADCLPNNYASSGYNLCDFGGNIDCSVLQSQMLPLSEENTVPVSPTASPIINPASPTPFVPTPTTFTIPTNGIYYCGCGNAHVTVCNVTFSIPPGGIPYYLDNACSNQCGQPC
jgi:hypothetical protein